MKIDSLQFMKLSVLLLSGLLISSTSLLAQVPEWIWSDGKGVTPADDEVRFFRKTFTLDQPVKKAVVSAAGDNHVEVFINGQQVCSSHDWKKPASANITKQLVQGENVMALRGENDSGIAAVVAQLEITFQDNRARTVVTEPTWTASVNETADWSKVGFDASTWGKVVSRGKLGVDPWGDVFNAAVATAASKLTTLPGFKVELLHSASKAEGSWICLAKDPKGRLTISPQNPKERLLRVTLNDKGAWDKVEPIPLEIGSAMGLLYAFDSLYVSGIGKEGTGLYRLKDTNGDDQFDEIQFLKKFDGDGEHGPHGIVLGPDKMLYIMNGNHTKVPNGLTADSPLQNFEEDLLLPRQWDANGHARGILAPGGYVVRTDAEGKKWELLLAGFRNAYDLAFNEEGELFTFDSDMEWDWGAPWYRATRIVHCVIGGEYGWRSGTGVWPAYYPDSLPPTLDVGLGSPTGVGFGTGAAFPEKYQKAFYAMDWSYGRIVAVHLQPHGATYDATFEPFVVGKPLNVTDLEVGLDGAMYFITGGRGTQSGLYRVKYEGGSSASSDKLAAANDSVATKDARALRRRLERFHGKQDPAAVELAWPYLDSPDRWIRYAARMAVESQPVSQWQERALTESRPSAALTALLALARKGNTEVQEQLMDSLGRFWPAQLDTEQKLEALRIAGLSFIRQGKPSAEMAAEVIQSLDPLFPGPDERLNRELAQMLVYLDAPSVVKKALVQVATGATQEDQLYYIFALRVMKDHWTQEDRRTYFSWFNRDRAADKHPANLEKWFKDVGRSYSDGASFSKFMANIKKEAVDTLSAKEKTSLSAYISGEAVAFAPVVQRSVVQEWKMEDLTPSLDKIVSGRSYNRGRQAFAAAQCLACHRFGNEGGAVGPDITGAASRFNARDLLETIIEPSKVISDQYHNTVVIKKDGSDVTGRLLEETNDKLVLRRNPLAEDTITIPKSEVKTREVSKTSPMPEGLVSILTREAILDLLAYIQSGGKIDHAAFK